jgi:hypothetical protein
MCVQICKFQTFMTTHPKQRINPTEEYPTDDVVLHFTPVVFRATNNRWRLLMMRLHYSGMGLARGRVCKHSVTTDKLTIRHNFISIPTCLSVHCAHLRLIAFSIIFCIIIFYCN